MTVLQEQIRALAADESGATAIEYGLIAALVAVGILIALTSMGGNVKSMFDYISSRSAEELDNADI